MLPGDTNYSRGTRKSGLISDRARIMIMGGLLGAIVLAYLLPDRVSESDKPVITRPPTIDVSAFRPDPKILAEIKDSTTIERGGRVKGSVWAHLLRKSYNIDPNSAAALQLPMLAADIGRLRARPGAHRGNYIWVKGKLEKFEQQKLHPIPRAKSYKGRLRTESGDQVIFWVSKPLPDNVVREDNPWVRVEGFFVKIVDTHYLDESVLNAPMIIGPRVEKAFPDWEPVVKLDQKVLAGDKNAVYVKETDTWIDTDNMADFLVDSQDVPLWHMAGFAIHEHDRLADSGQRHIEVFELKDQYTGFKHGTYERGAPLRLRGTFVLARVHRAKVNPLGIKYWTAVWIRIPRMGAKMIPIWIPQDIGAWRYGEGVDIDAFYFRNRAYQAQDYSVVHTPQFVAATLSRYKMVSHPATFWMGIIFAAFVVLVAVLFFNMNRRAKKESDEYKTRIVDRRRRRRASSEGFLQVET